MGAGRGKRRRVTVWRRTSRRRRGPVRERPAERGGARPVAVGGAGGRGGGRAGGGGGGPGGGRAGGGSNGGGPIAAEEEPCLGLGLRRRDWVGRGLI